MSSEFPTYLEVDYEAGAGQVGSDYPTLTDKLDRALAVATTALTQYTSPAVMWTGGKDSTLVLYVVREVARELGVDVPPVVFIDHFEHFPEVTSFVETWAERWNLDLVVARNEDLAERRALHGDEIPLQTLGERTRSELTRLGHDDETFVVDADSFAGNHLLKTVALNDVLREHGFDGVFSGVRWDEQVARADETFFSPRHDSTKYPPHDRIHPILQFTERDVWDAHWRVVVPETVDGYPVGHVPETTDDLPDGIVADDIPVSPKYFEGFRSLGTESGSGPATDRPAWLQDLDNTVERAERAQDKEDLMARLRDLGYM
ncbi:MAG: phosphoadenosine phosphosulfate reductase family protein [Halobacteriota archaeon]